MNNLKTKILLLIALFLGSPSVSYSRFKIRENISRVCERTFVNRLHKNSRIEAENLRISLSNEIGGMISLARRNNDLILSEYLEEFRASVTSPWHKESPTNERGEYFERFRTNVTSPSETSLSDLLRVQKRFNRLIFPWLFWRSTETDYIFNIRFRDDNRKKLQRWGEDSLGRSLNEQEAQALVEAYSYNIGYMDIRLDVQFFTKQQILKEAGFSEREMDQLGRKTTLQGRKTIVLEIPQTTSIEAALKVQGYEPDHIKGMDETKELMVAGNQLLDKLDEIDIYTAHIPYLAQKLKQYIAYMEKGISNSIQRERFERLKKYVEILIEEEGVTYDKWLALSLRLADILSERGKPYPILLQNLLKIFPKRIVMPTIAGLIGYMSLSGTRSKKVESIALVRQNTFVDGNELSPIGVVNHDKDHIIDHNGSNKDFYNALEKLIGKLPVKTIQNAVIAYHNLTHESQIKPIFTNDFLKMTIDTLRSELVSNFFRFQHIEKGGLEAEVDREESERKAQVIIDDFIFVFHEINRRKAQQINP